MTIGGSVSPHAIGSAGSSQDACGLAEPGLEPKERVRRMYVAAFAREPAAGELADSLAFLEGRAKETGKPDDPKAWAKLWLDTRERLARAEDTSFNRWSADSPVCA